MGSTPVTEPVSVSETRRTLDVADAAAILGVSVRHCYQMCREGQLPSIRVGGRVVIPTHQLEKLLQGDSAD